MKIWKANQRWAAMYIVPEGALVKGGQVVVEGAEAAVAALQKSDEGGALVSRAKGFVGRISEWLYRTWRNGVTPMEGSPISSTYCLPAVQQGQQALLDGAVGHDVISAGMTVATAQDVGVTGIVWDAVEATQPMYEGTPIPKSFTLTTMNGRIWVHGNATKHLAQYVLSAANHSADVSLTSQLLLRSLQGAVDEALKAGVSYDELKVVDGWELVFSASRSEGLLPVLKHALYIGK